MDNAPVENSTPTRRAGWMRKIGPGLVTACVVIGPGSILTSSKVGASDGYSKVWVVVLAVLFMMTYTALAAKLGAVSGQSTGDLVSKNAGRPLAVLIGYRSPVDGRLYLAYPRDSSAASQAGDEQMFDDNSPDIVSVS